MLQRSQLMTYQRCFIIRGFLFASQPVITPASLCICDKRTVPVAGLCFAVKAFQKLISITRAPIEWCKCRTKKLQNSSFMDFMASDTRDRTSGLFKPIMLHRIIDRPRSACKSTSFAACLSVGRTPNKSFFITSQFERGRRTPKRQVHQFLNHAFCRVHQKKRKKRKFNDQR